MDFRFFLLLSAIIAVTAGGLAYITLDYQMTDISIQDSMNGNDGVIGTGHFVVTVRDGAGQVTAYRQSNNAMVNSGENCALKLIFKDPDATGTTVCTGANTNPWRWMGLDEDPQVLTIDKDLRDPADEAGLSTLVKSTATWSQNSTASTDALSKSIVLMTNTFTNSGVATETVSAVGLFNDTSQSTRSMFSKGNFTATAVTVGSDITVEYTFEFGGGTVP